jgi:hypothetical protein
MANTILVGAQWGDEGKGKIIDVLTKQADVVVRYAGGNNAGHTVYVGKQKYVLHLVPSGILRKDKLCVIGNGVVVDPLGLVEEIEGLKKIGAKKGRGLLLLAEMSSSGTTAKGSHTKKAVALGEAHPDFVCGFISLRKLSDQPGMIHFTPGVKLEKGKDSLGQKYRIIEEVLVKNKSDVVIIGRDILQDADPVKTAAVYRERAWNAVH